MMVFTLLSQLHVNCCQHYSMSLAKTLAHKLVEMGFKVGHTQILNFYKVACCFYFDVFTTSYYHLIMQSCFVRKI